MRGRVQNGRLVVDEPCDLPEGTEVDLVGDDGTPPLEPGWLLEHAPPCDLVLSPEERARIDASNERGVWIPHEEVKKKLAAKKLAGKE